MQLLSSSSTILKNGVMIDESDSLLTESWCNVVVADCDFIRLSCWYINAAWGPPHRSATCAKYGLMVHHQHKPMTKGELTLRRRL
jgi:hypothetical protein